MTWKEWLCKRRTSNYGYIGYQLAIASDAACGKTQIFVAYHHHDGVSRCTDVWLKTWHSPEVDTWCGKGAAD
jgi:hypothetical protein